MNGDVMSQQPARRAPFPARAHARGAAARAIRPAVVAVAVAAVAAGLVPMSGCSSLPSLRTQDRLLGVVTPYRMEIVQGNVVTREQAERVRPGMTRPQVRELLGTPMLESAFHANRWDYPFTIRRQGMEPQRHVVTAFFDGDTLGRLEAQDLPSEEAFVAGLTRPVQRSWWDDLGRLVGRGDSGTAGAPVLSLTPEQRAALPRPAASAAESTGADLASRRDFPPLEAAR